MKTTPNLDKLTNLLATENITVEHRKVPTASFDVKSRVLTLPLWKEMSKELYHLLILHEVGHALYTPEEKWIDAVKDDVKLKGYVNVIEDARIERNMKNKYPGSRRDFMVGYKEIYERDIFGVKNKPTEKMNFIDRVNLYFKLGSSMDITFSPEEMEYVKRAETLTTFDDAVALSEEMLAYARETAETDQDHDFGEMSDEFGDWDENGDFEESSDNGNTADSKSEDEGSTPSSPANSEEADADAESEGETAGNSDDDYEDYDDDCDDDDDYQSGGHQGGEEWDDKVTATTDENLQKNMIDQLVDESAIPTTYIELERSYNYKKHIMPNKFIRETIRFCRAECKKDPAAYNIHEVAKFAEWDENTETRYSQFVSNNKQNVMYLVKEFEMKKAADQYSRSRDAKTGVIDPTKLHSYKYSDTIFKRISVLPDAKNHGLVMLTDFSGSMAENMNGTIEQLVNLVMFCRRVNIPHRVYGFIDSVRVDAMMMDNGLNEQIQSYKMKETGHMLGSSSTFLMELFSEKMNNAEFTEMTKYMLDFGAECNLHYGPGGYRRMRHSDAPMPPSAWRSFIFTLGGTPLNETLVYCRDIINDFRKETSAQIVNFVCLTDGDSNPFKFDHEFLRQKGHYDGTDGSVSYSRDMIIRDPITKLTERLSFRNRNEQTVFMLNVIRKSCDVNIINFYIAPERGYPYDLITMIGDSRNNAGRNSWIPDDEVKEIRKTWRREKHMSVPNTKGFDEVHMIMGGSALGTEATNLDDIKAGETRGKMARAFIKANTKRKTSRIILSKFIDKIAA